MQYECEFRRKHEINLQDMIEKWQHQRLGVSFHNQDIEPLEHCSIIHTKHRIH